MDFSQAWSGLLLLRSQWQRNAALAIVAAFVRGVEVRGRADAARTVFPVITVSARIRASRGRALSLPPHLPFGVAVNLLVLCPSYGITFFLACLSPSSSCPPLKHSSAHLPAQVQAQVHNQVNHVETTSADVTIESTPASTPESPSVSSNDVSLGSVTDPAIGAIITANMNFGYWSSTGENGQVSDNTYTAIGQELMFAQPDLASEVSSVPNTTERTDDSPELNATVLELPDFEPMADATKFSWGNVSGPDFCSSIEAAYDEIVHWRRNLFSVPTGRAGKLFVQELARLWRAYASASALERVALRASMVMCTLLLQKPHEKSKSRDHVSCLERRLQTWSDGLVSNLLSEGRTIQAYLRRGKKHRSQEDIMRTFTNLMLVGRVASAMRVLDENSSGGVLDLDAKVTEGKTVRDVLREKHPPAGDVNPEALVEPEQGPQPPHPILFERLTGESIKRAAMRTFGAAGPSGLDAAGWRRLCLSFHGASNTLCEALAAVGRRMSASFVDPDGLVALLACRLCPLDKCPGVRPVGISEVARRIIGKALMQVIGKDVRSAAGSLQLCAGQPAGCEAAIHAMKGLFDDDECEAVLLVDASNAFNWLNQQVALRNVRILCPALGTIAVNTYRSNTDMFVGGEKVVSAEGTTQGDPLAMALYAVAVTPLIRRVQQEGAKQIWFADDPASGGELLNLGRWWDSLNHHGPMFGYFVNSSKTWLVAKRQHLDSAKEIFRDTGVKISTEGKRHLGDHWVMLISLLNMYRIK